MLSHQYKRIAFSLLLIIVALMVHATSSSSLPVASAQEVIVTPVPWYCMGNCTTPAPQPPCTPVLGAKNYRDVKAAEDIKKIVASPPLKTSFKLIADSSDPQYEHDQANDATGSDTSSSDTSSSDTSNPDNNNSDSSNPNNGNTGATEDTSSGNTGDSQQQDAQNQDTIIYNKDEVPYCDGLHLANCQDTIGGTIKSTDQIDTNQLNTTVRPSKNDTISDYNPNTDTSNIINTNNDTNASAGNTNSESNSNITPNTDCEEGVSSDGNYICQDGKWKETISGDATCTVGANNCQQGAACTTDGSTNGDTCIQGATLGNDCTEGSDGKSDTCAGGDHCDSGTCVGDDTKYINDNTGIVTSHAPTDTTKQTETIPENGAVKKAIEESSLDMQNFIAAINQGFQTIAGQQTPNNPTTTTSSSLNNAQTPNQKIMYVPVGTQYAPIRTVPNQAVNTPCPTKTPQR